MVDVVVSLATTLALGAKKRMTILVSSRWVVPLDNEGSQEDVNIICVLKADAED